MYGACGLCWHPRLTNSHFEQIYGDNEAPHEDCFRMFNPITSADFEVYVVVQLALLSKAFKETWFFAVAFTSLDDLSKLFVTEDCHKLVLGFYHNFR